MAQLRTAMWSATPIVLLTAAQPADAPRPAPALVNLEMVTLHAAALSRSRGPADTSDAPFLVISIVDNHGRRETRSLGADGTWTLQADGAVGQTPAGQLAVEPGDSVRILVSVLEDQNRSGRPAVAEGFTRSAPAGPLGPAPTPESLTGPARIMADRGTHWLGSASLLVVNDAGTARWSRFDCVVTCTVLRPPAASAAGAVLAAAEPTSAVVELSGAAATYHLQLALGLAR
ncbi:MAG: hypothetical protein R2882_07715 [Gemmatimonadales bacterium]